ncbi:ComF family protein [Cupriavidus pauculus]|uniref:ComF family protein n=1 Tax=Cupriavidus pauculus TaxID=82633 RepID=UPI0020A3FC70|nr:ComF family protein [Cupriavidus pauculus]
MQGHGRTGQQGSDRQVRQSAAPSGATRGGPPEVYAPGLPRARRVFARHAAHLWRALLPSACLACTAVQRDVVCAACAARLLQPVPRCPRCATPHSHGPCGQCADDDPIDTTLTLGDYTAPFDRLILQLKFGGQLPAAAWLAERLAHAMRDDALPDLLVPIPLSASRLAERGFNQAWEIGRPLARRLGVPASPSMLWRLRDTASQRTLDLPARLANLRQAFSVSPAARLDGLHIALVDDVMTTGATLREAARALKAHGAARVTAVAALRTP